MADGVVCWDFDHTLFGFQGEAQVTPAAPREGEFRGFGLRPGIEATLQRLALLQLASDITPGASLALVTRALAATGASGILRHIARIFPGDEIAVGGSKYYEAVAQYHGLTPDEASKRMLVIGDLHADAPADLAGVVLIRQPYGHLRDPRVVEVVIGRLRTLGEGDFSRGFHRMREQAQSAARWIPYGGALVMQEGRTLVCIDESPPHPQRVVRLGDARIPVISLLESTLLAAS